MVIAEAEDSGRIRIFNIMYTSRLDFLIIKQKNIYTYLNLFLLDRIYVKFYGRSIKHERRL